MLSLSMLALATLTLSAPTTIPIQNTNLTNFLLVTTSQCEPSSNSSLLPNVSATSLFDPLDQTNFLLRLIAPGYESLPTFNMSNGHLQTLSEGPEGFGTFVYNSSNVDAGAELQFLPSVVNGAGNLALHEGYLLTVGGDAEGWTICEGAEDEQVISWKGTNSSCTATYLQAVSKAPY